MNLEQLQSMSDAELNELSAVKVMEWEKRGTSTAYFLNDEIIRTMEETSYGPAWNPATDMNDAMELWDKLHSQGWELNLSCDKKITTPWDCRLFLTDKDYNVSKRIIVHNKTAPRAITIASILAKE